MASSDPFSATRNARPKSVFGGPSPMGPRLGQTQNDPFDASPQEALRNSLLPLCIDPDHRWRHLAEFSIDPTVVERSYLITQHAGDPVGLLHDHLRTRVLQAMTENGWTRLGICGPTKDCGSSTLAANLALSLARRPSGRTVLLDTNLRHPSLARMFGQAQGRALRDMLLGQPFENHLLRLGRTLAIAFNDQIETNSAELLQEPSTALALATIQQELAPDMMLFDLPPLLETDDTLAMLPLVDAVILVADGTRTTAADITEAERLLKDKVAILGVVMNRAEDSPARHNRKR